MSDQTELSLRQSKLSPARQELLQRWMNNQAGNNSKGITIPRHSIDDPLTLSFAQQRMWFENQLDLSSSRYNIVLAFRLNGRLNREAMNRAIYNILDRHEVLRTYLPGKDGNPHQEIVSLEALKTIFYTFSDLSTLSEQEKQVQIEQILNGEAQKSFHLMLDIPIRLHLLKIAVNEHIFVCVLHHIATDERGTDIFLHEMSVLYKAFSLNQPSPLSPLPIQYVDYAIWQRKQLQGQFLQQGLDYWQKKLAGAPPLLDLPTDYPRPPRSTFQGGVYSFHLSADLVGQIKLLSQQENATLFMALLTVFQVLLYRCSGQRDISVGTPITNRMYKETEDLIGFFLNTLVIRIVHSDSSSFHSLLAQVREVALEAYTYQEIPFERVVEALHPPRNNGYHPLFQVMFAVQDASSPGLELEGLTTQQIKVDRTEVLFDLTLTVQISAEKSTCIFEYRMDLFSEQTIQYLGMRFQTLLEGIVQNPHQRVSELPLLSSLETQKLLTDWNATRGVFSDNEFVQSIFEEQAERTPEAIALCFADQFLTYRELENRSNQLAHYLRIYGVSSNIPVGICLPRSIDQFISLLGILKAGGCYVPLDLSLPKTRLLFMIENACLPFLITYDRFTSLFANVRTQLVVLDKEYDHIMQAAHSRPTMPRPHFANTCYILYTSGSTGYPKGTLLPHRALFNLIYDYSKNVSRITTNRTLQFSPLIFDLSFLEVFATWSQGGTVVLVSEEIKRDTDQLLSYLREEGIERIHLPFVALQQLAEIVQTEAQSSLPALKEIVSTGEQLRITPEIRNWLKALKDCVLHNLYGPTETHVVTYYTLAMNADTWELLPPIGFPISNTQIYLLDEHMQLVPVGGYGELYVGGHSLGLGYVNAPHLTAASFCPDPFSQEPGARLYKTGDLCRYRPDGSIEYLGRKDHQMKVRGFRIEPAEIEAALNQHPQIKGSVVRLREDMKGNKRLVAYLIAQRGDERQPFPVLTSSLLRSYLQEKLPGYMIPADFTWQESFPLTPTGKIDYKALPRVDTFISDEKKGFTPPSTPVESLLVSMWSEVLGIKEVGIHDNFFDLGGHSLLATRLISRIRAAFNVDLPLRDLFEKPTIMGLSRRIESALRIPTRTHHPLVPCAAGRESIPLSFAQQRMWLLDQLGSSKSSSYNIQLIFQMEGILDRIAFRRAIFAIIARHDILRTYFPLSNGQPEQQVEPMNRESIPFVSYDLLLLNKEQQDKEFAYISSLESKHVFDLEKGSLLRIHLLQLGEARFVLILSTHHIIFDGWSTEIFFRELASLYTAFSHHQPSTLAPLPIQYADYACWQRDWLQEKALEADLSYWKDHLAGAPPLLELPTDRPRPSVQTFHGGVHEFLLPATLSSQIKILCQQEGVTLFMFLLAAFQLLLARYSGQEDILVGVPIANRTYAETEEIIGCFINTLVMRVNLSGSPSFRTFLARVREISLQAYMHQDIPFDYLIEKLQVPRDTSYHPLFQVMFSLQNASRPLANLPGITVQPLPSAYTTTKFDLTLALGEDKKGISGVFEYSTALFDKQTIERMEGHFRTLLEGIVVAPERCILELPLCNQTELQMLLEAWNATQKEWPRNSTLPILFEKQVECTPDALAVVYEDAHITYHKLNCRSNQLAHYLMRKGVRLEVPVGVYLDRSIELIVALIGILKAGGAYVPIDPSYPQERVRYTLSDAGVSILITSATLHALLKEAPGTVMCLDADWTPLLEESQENPSRSAHPENLCYIIYTSGSSGKPKGVSIPHRGVTNLLAWHRSSYELTTSARATQIAGLAFDAAVWEIWPYLTAGASIHLPDPVTHASPDLLVEWMKLSGCTHTFIPTPLAQLALSNSWLDGTTLRYLLTGGDKLYRPASQHQVFQLINHYGPTESTVVATSAPVNLAENCTGDPPIGRPIMNTHIYILDHLLQPVPIGVVGELYIGGVGLARGYLGLPDLTAERFIPNPFDPIGGSRLYNTGDLARYRSNGDIEYVGRADRQIKIRGFRIELGEIEAVISQHPQVHQAAVILQEDLSGEKQICAYVVPHSEATLTVDELRQYLRTWLPTHMLPSSYTMLSALPLTANGKVDRTALAHHKSEIPITNSAAPGTEIERILLHIWQEILKRDQISIHDNFFDIGGYSLLLVQMHRKVKEYFKKETTVLDLFTFPTVASFAAYLSQGEETFNDPGTALSRANKRAMKTQQQRVMSSARKRQRAKEKKQREKGDSENDE